MSLALTDINTARSFIGKSVSELPVPSFVVDRGVIKSNIEHLHAKLEVGPNNTPIKFRPHVKTLKTLEVTEMALGEKYHSVVASTLEEIRGMASLVEKGTVKDILYGVPIGKSKIHAVGELNKSYNGKATVAVFVDHVAQAQFLAESEYKWEVMIKADTNDNRAGIVLETPEFKQLFEAIEKASNITLKGVYVHAGSSYGSTDLETAKTHLFREISTLVKASKSISKDGLLLSFGATPTAHAFSSMDMPEDLGNFTLELHAGNFVALDLQQASTHLASLDNIAGYTQSEIVSHYPERGEYLVNAGVLALTREPGRFGGFAHVKGRPGWKIERVSQEHGILKYFGEETSPKGFEIGERVKLLPQHMCITSAMHKYYFVVDGSDEIVDVWIPWKFW